MPSAPKKALIIQTASIGDVILCTALAESLHAAGDGIHVDILVKDGMQGLFTGHPYIRRVLVWDKRSHKYHHLYRLIREVRKEHYDVVINVQRFLSTGIITLLSGARLKAGFRKNPLSFGFTHSVEHDIGNGLHETERNFGLIRWIEDTRLMPPRLYPGSSDEERIAGYLGSAFITAAPASLWFTKQYPEERWVEFLQAVPSSYRILLLGGPSDRALCERIRTSVTTHEVVSLAGDLSLLASAALMKYAHMNYVNDSAPMHLASSVNAPIRAIFCSTIPAFGFGPLSDDSAVIECEPGLACRPCGLHGLKQCPEGHFKCAHTIEKSKLLQDLCL